MQAEKDYQHAASELMNLSAQLSSGNEAVKAVRYDSQTLDSMYSAARHPDGAIEVQSLFKHFF